MRIILLLVSLLIIVLLAYQELDLGAPPAVSQPKGTVATDPNGLPRVPTNPQDLQSFNHKLNTFVQNSAAKRAKEIQQQTK